MQGTSTWMDIQRHANSCPECLHHQTRFFKEWEPSRRKGEGRGFRRGCFQVMRSIVPLPSIVSGTEWVWVSILTSTNLCDKERWLSQNHRKMKTVPCSFPSPIFTTASPISLSTPLPTRLFWSSFSLRMISSSCHCFRLLVFNDDPTVQGVEF